jgi:Tat protein secretion system quality control protein TatD with DNase activity
MIIDCHTHLGRNEHITSDVKELLSSMDSAKIDKALVFAGELNNITTPEMLAEIEPYRDRLYGVASWNFGYTQQLSGDYGTWALGNHQSTILSKLYKAGHIAAVKFYTGYDHYMPDSPQVRYALEALQQVKCPVIFHCGDCLNSVCRAKLKYAHPLNIDEVAVDYPNINFIIAHMGYPWIKDAAEVCYKNKNVFTDISGFVYKDFETEDKIKFKKILDEFLDIAGSDKLLFGTDFPISNQRSYMEALDWVATNSMNKKVSEIFCPEYMTRNTIRAFNLNVQAEGKNQR